MKERQQGFLEPNYNVDSLFLFQPCLIWPEKSVLFCSLCYAHLLTSPRTGTSILIVSPIPCYCFRGTMTKFERTGGHNEALLALSHQKQGCTPCEGVSVGNLVENSSPDYCVLHGDLTCRRNHGRTLLLT